MELRLLHYFLAVAREENITRAAENLHLTQPTLSRQLAQLETELGTVLFKREKRRISLTDQGVLFRRRAQEILDLVAKTEQEVTEQEEAIAGNIAVGCGELSAIERLGDVIAAFHERYPRVTFNLIAGDADQTDHRMEMGLIDLAVFLEPMDLSRYNYIRLGQTEEWVAMLPADDALGELKTISPQDLVDKNLILPLRDRAYNEIVSWMGGAFNQDKVVARNNLATNSSILVKKGLGYALVVDGSRPYLDENIFVKRTLKPALKASTVLAWKQHQPLSFSVNRFVEFAKKYFK